jgi:hypothetical protein
MKGKKNGKEILTSDFRFMNYGLQSIELLFGEPVKTFKLHRDRGETS